MSVEKSSAPAMRGEPNDAAKICLVVLSNRGRGRRLYVGERTVVGRSIDCALVVDEVQTSRRHALIYRVEGGEYRVQDLESRNGTFLNGKRIKDAVLTFGDRIRIGTKVALLFTKTDPTEEELRHRQRLETLGRLSTGIAHDFRNMVGAISTTAAYLRSLSPEERAGEEAEDCLADIELATDRAAQLATRLMMFTQPEPGGHAHVDLGALGREAAELCRRTFPRAVTVSAECQEGLVVLIDSAQLHQVIMNLCVNARDAITAKGGTGSVVVRVEASGDAEAAIIVSDDGTGIEKEVRERLFEPFFSTKPRGVGFGLGLATTAEIVTYCGGRIEVDSTPGKGSTFRVSLPRVEYEANKSNRRRIPTARAVPRGGGRTIMLVDDEAVLRNSIGRVLRRAGFAVITEPDGVQALASLKAASRLPAAVLLDLDMPYMHGEEVLRELKRAYPSLPVVVLSGHLPGPRGADPRSDGRLTKPFSPEELLVALGEVLVDTAPPEAWEEDTPMPTDPATGVDE